MNKIKQLTFNKLFFDHFLIPQMWMLALDLDCAERNPGYGFHSLSASTDIEKVRLSLVKRLIRPSS